MYGVVCEITTFCARCTQGQPSPSSAVHPPFLPSSYCRLLGVCERSFWLARCPNCNPALSHSGTTAAATLETFAATTWSKNSKINFSAHESSTQGQPSLNNVWAPRRVRQKHTNWSGPGCCSPAEVEVSRGGAQHNGRMTLSAVWMLQTGSSSEWITKRGVSTVLTACTGFT